MKTPYAGRAELGDVVVTVEIDNVDTMHWDAAVTDGTNANRFRAGPMTVTLLDQPRPGWSAIAVAERHADGSQHLIGTGHFRAEWQRARGLGTGDRTTTSSAVSLASACSDDRRARSTPIGSPPRLWVETKAAPDLPIGAGRVAPERAFRARSLAVCTVRTWGADVPFLSIAAAVAADRCACSVLRARWQVGSLHAGLFGCL
jgi:hypothetical protein